MASGWGWGRDEGGGRGRRALGFVAMIMMHFLIGRGRVTWYNFHCYGIFFFRGWGVRGIDGRENRERERVSELRHRYYVPEPIVQV